MSRTSRRTRWYCGTLHQLGTSANQLTYMQEHAEVKYVCELLDVLLGTNLLLPLPCERQILD